MKLIRDSSKSNCSLYRILQNGSCKEVKEALGMQNKFSDFIWFLIRLKSQYAKFLIKDFVYTYSYMLKAMFPVKYNHLGTKGVSLYKKYKGEEQYLIEVFEDYVDKFRINDRYLYKELKNHNLIENKESVKCLLAIRK